MIRGASVAILRTGLAKIRREQAVITRDFKDFRHRLDALERRPIGIPRSTPAECQALGEWLLASIRPRVIRRRRTSTAGRKP